MGAKETKPGKAPSRWKGAVATVIQAGWSARADLGTVRHAAMEKVVRGLPLTEEEEKNVPIGFIKFLIDHPEIVPWRAEWRLFDEDARISGCCDLLCEQGIILDWKNVEHRSIISNASMVRRAPYLSFNALSNPKSR